MTNLQNTGRDWAKTITVVITACGLIASVGSSVAAWAAWRTARAMEDLGRYTFDMGGPQIAIDPYLKGNGNHCTSAEDPFTATVVVRNQGRLTGHAVVDLTVDGAPPYRDEIAYYQSVGPHPQQVAIPAQSEVEVRFTL